MSRKYIGINIRLEDDRKTINYMSIGQMVEGKFNGIVYSYKGGGVYSDWYVYQDKYLPTTYSDNEAVDDDTAEQWLNHLVNDNNFVKSCHEKMSNYIVFEAVHLIKEDKLGRFENKNCYAHNIGISSKIVIEDDSAEYYEWDEFVGLFDWKYLIKDCLDHQITINQNGELGSSELVNEAISALMGDDVYGSIFNEAEVRNYITKIADEIETRNCDNESNLCDMNIQDCGICTECGTVLLADDELYESSKGESLCQNCSILCEGCNQYFVASDIFTDKDGVDGCKNCIEKEGKTALKSFEVFAERREEYKANIIASSEEEAKELANENYSDYDFVEVDGTLDTQIIGLNEVPTFLYQLEKYDQWFSRDSLENFGIFSSKEKAIEAIEQNVGPIDDGTEGSFYWNGENQLMSNDMGSFQFNKVELDCFGES